MPRKNANAATGDGGARQKVNRNVPANTEIAKAAQDCLLTSLESASAPRRHKRHCRAGGERQPQRVRGLG
jgi:hypothetical protein